MKLVREKMSKKGHTLEQLRICPVMLAMDIGTGTKDVFYFKPDQSIENNIKLVVPTPSLLIANEIENSQLAEFRIAGFTVGGGYLAKVLRKKVREGKKIIMEELPAYTVRNNLEEVREAGIVVQSNVENPTHYFDEIELSDYYKFLTRYQENPDEIGWIGISVQDHGYHTSEESARKNRFMYFYEHLKKNQHPLALVFTDKNLPPVFGRLNSAMLYVKKFNKNLRTILIDTSFSAILGCILDTRIKLIDGPILYINFGNGHVMACVIYKSRIQAFFEHHTRVIKNKPQVMNEYMKRLVEGKLDSEEIFNDDGNGCITFEPQPYEKISAIVVTGPQRQLVEKIGWHNVIEAAPGGDMMMTGPLGLIHGLSLLIKENFEKVI